MDVGHRLGPFNKDQPRGIILKFVRRTNKHAVIQLRSRLANTQYVIKEDLTNVNRALMDKMRQRDNVSAVWSTNGKIFAEVENENGNKKVRKVESDLKARIRNFERPAVPHPQQMPQFRFMPPGMAMTRPQLIPK